MSRKDTGNTCRRSISKRFGLLPLLIPISLLPGSVLAALDAGGPVTSDTVWHVSDSPIQVTADVVIDNGATLTIEPGSRVEVSPGFSLTVLNGALVAAGNANAKITITSSRDFAGSPTPAQPGDWGALSFLDGTHDAGTLLAYVNIRYGSGIVVEHASPTFQNLSIRYHAAPAIELDLASSPLGSSLSAQDNQLNGILVPAGQINSDVVWGLRGIPYVVAAGEVDVGALSFGLQPSHLRLVEGTSGQLQLAIPEPAVDPLAVDLVSSVPSVATVPANATFASGQSEQTVTVNALVPGTTAITASHAGLGLSVATVQVVEPPELALGSSVTSVGVGKQITLNLSLSEPAPAGGLEVTLLASNPGLADFPDQINVAAGTQSAPVPVTGVALGTLTVTASASGWQSDSFEFTVRPVALDLPASFVLSPNTVRNLPITLSDPAPAGGLIVTLTATDPSMVTIPATITVPAGATTANALLTGLTLGTTTLQASAPGYEGDSTPLVVEAIAIQINTGDFSVPSGLYRDITVQLSKGAPIGGIEIALTSSDPGIAALSPSTVFIPQGQTAAATPVRVQALAQGTAVITASSPGLEGAQRTVTVIESARLEFYRTTQTIGKGLRSPYGEQNIQLWSGQSYYNTPYPLTISIQPQTSGYVGPTTVTIPSGFHYIDVALTGLETTTQPVLVSASAEGYAAPATPLAVTVVTPSLKFNSLDGTRALSSARDQFTAQWYVPGAINPNSQTAANPFTVALQVEEPQPPGIVEGVYDTSSGGSLIAQTTIAQGQSSSPPLYIASPTVAGTYKVNASVAGVGSWTSALQTVLAPELIFSRTSLVVGKGLRSNGSEVTVQRRVNGQLFVGVDPLQVTITSADPSLVGGQTVTIPANASQVGFSVSGEDLTAQPVMVDASAPGYASPVTPLAVNVIPPMLQLIGLDNNRSPASTRDDFSLRWYVTGAIYPYQTAATATSIAVQIDNAQPAGIVEGFYTAATDGNLTTQVVMPQGSNFSPSLYIGQPTIAGSYQVTANVAGIGSWTSAAQTVQTPELVFTRSIVVVGKGLRSNGSEVAVQRRVNGQAFNGAVALTVSLQCSAAVVCSVPSSVTIPAGAAQAYFSVDGIDLGATTIVSSALGYLSIDELDVSIVTPELHLSGLAATISIGGSGDFRAYFYTPGAGYPIQTALIARAIDLVSSTPSVATVPSTVSIAVGNSHSGYAQITGVAAGTFIITASTADAVPVTSSVITVGP